MRICYLGPQGTFSEKALLIYIKDIKKCDIEEVSSIPDIISRLSSNACDEAIVPIENSIEGSVNVTLDMLINDAEDLMIKREIIIPISHCLIACDLIDLNNIRYIISHPQALAQCRQFIKENMFKARLITAESTAKAVLEAKYKDAAAAIGNERSAEIYEMKILARDIQDIKENYTRFIVLSHKDSEITGNDKTSLVFSVSNTPGSLYKVLGVFADENINMTKIESRPSRRKFGEYVFWVDIEGHRCDNHIITVLNKLNGKTDFLKILGSYPKFK
jgi:prephenate dehydratase